MNKKSCVKSKKMGKFLNKQELQRVLKARKRNTCTQQNYQNSIVSFTIFTKSRRLFCHYIKLRFYCTTCIKAEAKTTEYRGRNDFGWLPYGNQISSNGIYSDYGIQIGDKLWLVLDSSHGFIGMDLGISKYYHLLT